MFDKRKLCNSKSQRLHQIALKKKFLMFENLKKKKGKCDGKSETQEYDNRKCENLKIEL